MREAANASRGGEGKDVRGLNGEGGSHRKN
jgi:hypothetical protein